MDKEYGKRKVIIDTDPGIDDFFALILAKSSPVLDIRGITVAAGNQKLEKVAANALGIAEYLGIDAPVAIGASKPLILEQITAGEVHGKTGLGEFPLPVPKKNFDRRYAWDLIYEEAVVDKGELELITIGPMTNVAIALLRHPDLAGSIRRIVAMGGSAEWGNRGAYGEFNFYVDPHAAQIVFSSGIHIDMVGLNVTMKTGMSEADFEEIRRLPECPAECMNLLEFYRNSYKANNLGFDIVAMHDSLAVAYAICPTVLKMQEGFVEIETDSGRCRGRSIVAWDHKPNARIGVNVDNPLFMKLIKRSFTVNLA